MIQESPELLAVARRWYKAVVSRDPGQVQNFMSKDANVGFIGSAEGEIWFGPAVREAIGEHFDEIPIALSTKELRAEAFENGDTGWSFFHMEFHFEGRPTPTRFHSMLIFVLEEGSWKIALRHTSVPGSNLDMTGHEHSAIQALVDAAQKGFSLNQRTGLASVMFTDIVNSSPLAAALGDAAWTAIVTDHFDQLRGIIERHGGQFVKSLGDGTLSSFTSVGQALAAARDCQTALSKAQTEPRLSIRIGLHTGDVVQSQDDFFGTVVNKAARITSATQGGEICLSDATRAMMGDTPEFAFSPPQTVTLKGLEGDHVIHRLEWRA